MNSNDLKLFEVVYQSNKRYAYGKIKCNSKYQKPER